MYWGKLHFREIVWIIGLHIDTNFYVALMFMVNGYKIYLIIIENVLSLMNTLVWFLTWTQKDIEFYTINLHHMSTSKLRSLGGCQ